MFFFKKNISGCLYIFFIFLTFNFIEFSTKEVLAKTFVVSKIEVQEKYNLNFNKLTVIDRGFKKAFQDISQMILERKDLDKIRNTPIDDIKKLIESFSILDEKFVNQKYKSIMEVEFNRKKLIKFLDSKNITLSLPKKIDVLLIPILVDLETNNFKYLNENIFVKNWKSIEKNYFQITYIMPNEDVEDYLSIKNNLQNIENYNFKKICEKIGFPVLIKASGGGGGKGMKIVNKLEEFENLFLTAKQEAKKFFGNDEVYIEKFFQNPRHIEVQVLSGKNRTVHLHERDCSVQRRHQKLIEETPSPVLDDNIRKDLFEKTVSMVSKIGYEGAGTVEFIYEDGKFYFLEMNTRVQVEHPVTEMVTGIDIIKEQIWIAFSGDTALKQSDVNPRGHAIECRINAEDPSNNFQPSPGKIGMCHQPSGFRTRVDGSIYQGYKITPYYDSMVCKIITHGRNREEAIQRMLRSLDEFVIDGITTTIDLHKVLLKNKKFITSEFNVSWLDKEKVI